MVRHSHGEKGKGRTSLPTIGRCRLRGGGRNLVLLEKGKRGRGPSLREKQAKRGLEKEKKKKFWLASEKGSVLQRHARQEKEKNS